MSEIIRACRKILRKVDIHCLLAEELMGKSRKIGTVFNGAETELMRNCRGVWPYLQMSLILSEQRCNLGFRLAKIL